jgi:hypothetical protein
LAKRHSERLGLPLASARRIVAAVAISAQPDRGPANDETRKPDGLV